MKIKYIMLCMLSIYSGKMIAAEYTNPIDLISSMSPLKPGDIFNITSGRYAIRAVENGAPAISAGGANGFKIKFDVSSNSPETNAVHLLNDQIHNLGEATEIDAKNSSGDITGLKVEGANKGEVIANQIKIDASSSSRISGATGVFGLDNAKIDLGNKSTITVSNNRVDSVWNRYAAIHLENNSNLIANEISLIGNNLSAGVILDKGSTIDLGRDSSIEAGFMGVLLLNDDNKFKADQITIKVDAQPSKSQDPFAGVHINADGSVDLGSNSTIITGRDTTGVLLYAGNFKADSLTLHSTGENSEAIHTTGISNTSITGKSEILGDINATGRSVIALDTTQGSAVTGAINAKGAANISWGGTGATWNVTNNSNLNSLSFDKDSLVNLAYSDQYNDVKVNDLSGEAFWKFKISFDDDLSDTLHVTGKSEGKHKVGIVNNGSEKTNGTEKKDIIFTQDGIATFTADKEYELGGYLYTVQRKDKDENSPVWEIASTGKTSPITEVNIASVVSNYLLNLAEQEHLQRRMSTIRNNPEANGLWMRTFHGKFDSFKQPQLKNFDMDYSGIQMGLDRVIDREDNNLLMLGGSLNYTDAKQNYESGKGKQKSYSLALYGTYFNEDNWYTDLYAKYSNYRNKLNMRDTENVNVDGKGDGYSLTASAELGKRYYYDELKENKIYVEPNAQLAVSQIHSDSISNSNGLLVKFDNQTSTIARVGYNVGYDVMNITNPVTLYGRVNFAHEFNGKQKYYLNGSPETLKLADSWIEFGVGARATFKKDHNLFFEFSHNNGNRFDKNDLNLGYRYTF